MKMFKVKFLSFFNNEKANVNLRQPRFMIYSSFNNIIPSEDLVSGEYSMFLSYASDIELDTDTISQATYYKICRSLNKPVPIVKPQFPTARLVTF